MASAWSRTRARTSARRTSPGAAVAGEVGNERDGAVGLAVGGKHDRAEALEADDLGVVAGDEESVRGGSTPKPGEESPVTGNFDSKVARIRLNAKSGRSQTNGIRDLSVAASPRRLAIGHGADANVGKSVTGPHGDTRPRCDCLGRWSVLRTEALTSADRRFAARAAAPI